MWRPSKTAASGGASARTPGMYSPTSFGSAGFEMSKIRIPRP
jgi:hypothetical protein